MCLNVKLTKFNAYDIPNPPKFTRELPGPSRILYAYNGKIWGMVMDTGMKHGGWETIQLV